MQTESCSKNILQKFASCLFNFGLMTGLATLTFGLVSCGGGGSTTSPDNLTPTITSITPSGMVASSVSKTLSLAGTNFVNGMILSITNSSGVPYTITSSSVTSATVLTATVTVPAAPTDNYVTFAIKSSGGTTLASTVLGVSNADKRVANGIQAIFDSKCAGCHTGSTSAGGMDLRDATIGNSTGVIGIASVACTSKFRVVPGDPRRTSSVLIDKIMALPTSLPCTSGKPMPPSGTPLTSQEITDIIDWVAGGAN